MLTKTKTTKKGGSQIKTKLSARRAKERAAKANPMAVEPVSAANSETGKDELYLIVGGERVAYRGHPDTLDAGTWVSLHPDRFKVHNEDGWNDGLPDDTPVIDAGEVQLLPEPTSRVQ